MSEPRKIMNEVSDILKNREDLRRKVKLTFEFYNVDAEKEEKIIDWAVDVLEQGIDDLRPVLLDLEAVIVSSGSCHRKVFHGGNMGWVENLLIFLPEFAECEEKEAKYLMAVEFGHLALFHWKVNSRYLPEKIREAHKQAAEALAESWGFPRPKSFDKGKKEE